MTENDWNEYKSPVEINQTNATDYNTFSKNDPESMVSCFYASRIRGDEKWREVLPPESEWPRRLRSKIAKSESWKFIAFQLVKKKQYSEHGLWITARFELEVNGKTDQGENEITLRSDGTEWIIEGIPC